MQRLSQHLLSLLRLYDSVALPGVGYFNIEYVSARFDAQSSIFFPPFYSLSFEISYMAEDDLLLTSYMRKEQISKEEAWEMLKRDVDNLLNLLDRDKEVILKDIGTFVYENEEVDFYPSLSLNVELPPLKFNKIRNENTEASDVSPEVADSIDEVPVVSAETEGLKENPEEDADSVHEEVKKPDPVVETQLDSEEENESELEEVTEELPEAEEEEKVSDHVKIPQGYYYHKPEYFYIPVHKYFANISACILLVVVVGLSAILFAGSSCNQSGTASIVPISVNEKSDSTISSDTVAHVAEALHDTVATSEPAKPKKERKPRKRSELATDDNGVVVPGANSLTTSPYLQSESRVDKYYAVIAALGTQKEVKTFMEMHKHDMQKYKIIRNKKISLVTVSSSNNRKELETQMPLIRTDYPNAWIFTMK